MRTFFLLFLLLAGVSSLDLKGQGFPNIPRTAGELLTPLLEPNQGRTAVIAYHNGWLYTAPEGPASQPGSDVQARRWNLADLDNVTVEEVLGPSPMPLMAHGYLKKGNFLALGPNWPPAAPWSFEATAPNVNLRTVTPDLEGVFQRRHLYQPWGATTFWSYSDVNYPLELTFDGAVQASWDHLGLTGVVGLPFIVGNILIMASDQTRTGVATYDISDPTSPQLLDVLKTGGPGGYWPSLWGGDGQLFLVFPYRTGGNGIRVVDVTDPANLQFVADVPLPGDECMYAQYQDEACFVGNYKVDMRTLSPVVNFPSAANGIDTSQFLLPLGNLLVTGGSGPGQGMAVWAHENEPDTTGPAVAYHIPRAGQTNYPVGMPISILIHETLESPTIVPGTTFIIQPTGGSQIAGEWVWAFDDTLTFTPDAPLLPDTTYEVIFPEGGIKDAAGNGIEGYAYTFSTGSEVSGNQPPQITSWSASTYPVAPGETVTLSATGEDPDLDPVEFRFDFGDGSAKTEWDTATLIDHIYPTPGHYQAKVQIRDPSGLITTDAITVTVTSALAGGPRPVNSGPIACDESNRLVWSVNPDNDTVTAMHADTLAVEFEVPVGNDPRGVAVDGTGHAWVTCHQSDEIMIISPAGLVVETIALDYGDGPFGIVISPNGSDAWISLQSAGEVCRFSVAGRTETATIPVGPTPRALALSSDGGDLYVSRFLSPASRGEVRAINTASESVSMTMVIHKFGGDAHRDGTAEGMGVANYLTGLALSPDGGQLLVTCNKMNTDKGAFTGLDLDSDNTVRNLVCIFDTTTGQLADALDIDNSDSAHGIAFSPLGDYFLVALQGNNDVIVFDKLAVEAEAGLGGLINRTSVGAAPRGIAIDGPTQRAFVKNFMGRSVSVLELGDLFVSGETSIGESEIDTVATEAMSPEVLLGKQIFYHAGDPRMSAEGYMSCATCHLDGGHDGRVWDFTGRGEGFRNTTSLRGRSGIGHGNVHWSGNFDEIQDFENDIRNAFGGTGFLTTEQFSLTSDPLGSPKSGLNPDLDALAAYVASLGDESIPRSPHRAADGSPTEEALEGAQLFEAMNCSSCHSGETMQDGLLHNVGTLRTTSGQRLGADLPGIDTPSLRGLWNGAPYLHDGSAATLEEVFTLAGGTSYPAENGSFTGAVSVPDASNIFINHDQIPHHGGAARLPAGGEIEIAGVDGGSGGQGTIEIRYAAAWNAFATLRINGVEQPVFFPAGTNSPTWRATDYRALRFFNVELTPGATNTIELIGDSGGNTIIDDFVVSNADDLAAAAVHRQVSDLDADDQSRLFAFLNQLDGSALPTPVDPGPDPEPEPDDIAPLGDEFDDPATLTNWQRLNEVEGWNADKLELLDIDTSVGGSMRIMPHTTSWYADLTGPLVHKEISGDFVVTLSLDVTRRNDQAGRPTRQYSLGGIMIRTPRSITSAAPDPPSAPGVVMPWPPAGYTTDWTPDGENYIFLSYGNTDSSEAADQWTYEVKTTINGNSTLYFDSEGVPAGESRVTLQAVRRGATFVLMRKHGEGPWIIENRYERLDMPETLQVGITTYTDWENIIANGMFAGNDDHDGMFHHNRNVMTAVNGFTVNPDLVVDADYFRFARPAPEITEFALQTLPLTSDGAGVQYLADSPLAGVLGNSVDQPYNPGPDPQPPGEIAGLTAIYTGQVESGIALDWDDLADADSYQIWRASLSDPTNFSEIGTSIGSAYTDLSITVGASYLYRVRGINAEGSGAFSDAPGEVAVPIPSPRPDLMIGRTQQFPAGNDLYNRSGAGQTVSVVSRAGRKIRAIGRAENDSTHPHAIPLSTKGIRRNVRLKLFLFENGRQNLTAALRSGSATTGVLPPTESVRFDVHLKPSRSTKRFTLQVQGGVSDLVDIVRLRARIRSNRNR